MTTRHDKRARIAYLVASLLAGVTPLHAQTNSWINFASGKWETSTNWSLGAPIASDSIFITNTGTKTVTFDGLTVTNFPGTTTVTNLTLSAPSNSVNTLLLTDAGSSTPLHVVDNLTLLSGGALTISNSSLTVDNGIPPLTLPNGSYVQLDGVVAVINGTLNTSNALETVVGAPSGLTDSASLSMTNGIFTPHEFIVGGYSDATATFVSSTCILGTGLSLANVGGYTGNLYILGGQFIVTNTHGGFFQNLVQIGDRGNGNLTVSNANVQFDNTTIGNIRGSSGTITLHSGTMTLGKTFLGIDSEPGPPGPTASGSILIQGGAMSMPELHIGSVATGMVTVAGGTLSAPVVTVGDTNSATGTFNIAGGTTVISSLLQVGTNNSTATLSLTGGALYVTNAGHNASVVVNGGTFFNLGGKFVHDGDLLLTNGATLVTSSNYVSGSVAGSTNNVTITGSSLVVSNSAGTGVVGLGNNGTTNGGSGTASATLTNATVSAPSIILGSTAGGIGNLNLQSNATVNVSSNLTVVSGSMVATSSVTVAAGALLNATNGAIAIGPSGRGSLTMNGGTVLARQVNLGGIAGSSSGFLHIIAGLLRAAGLQANLIVVDGGDLDGSSGICIIGQNHDAEIDVNHGSAEVGTLYVGYTPGFTGTFKQSGGIVVVSTNMIVGDCVNGALGVPIVSGGTLYVTNAAHTAVLDVRNGTFVLNAGGTLVVDNLILTNACGHFLKAGGTLIMNHPPTLDPNLDADGDGQSNGAEALAGTDPLDPTSRFQMISATVTNKDVWVSWTTVGGHSYVVQTNGNLGVGVFHDLSPVIAVPGSSAGVTNYQHKNGATNRAEIYRVRLGP